MAQVQLTVLLMVATATSLGAIGFYWFELFYKKKERCLKITMGEIEISIKGDFTREQAGSIMKAASAGNIFDEKFAELTKERS